MSAAADIITSILQTPHNVEDVVPATRLKLFEHEQSIVYDCEVRKDSFNASLCDAVVPIEALFLAVRFSLAILARLAKFTEK